MYSKIQKIQKFLLNPRKWLINRALNAINRYRTENIYEALGSYGDNVSMQMPIRIEGAEKVKIGSRVSIAAFVHIWGNGGVEIGDDTLIASHVAITSLTHDTAADLFAQSLISKPVIIGCNVWIGTHASILPGVKIGNGAIIGAGAVVTKDVSENMIVVGVPARAMRNRLST
jgi:acetyltransferase-like isoleucine patch superfamily enzyme